MTPEDFASLEISRYELRLRAEEACSLPAFLGSTLRGAFGHALRQAVSAIDDRDCDGCSGADPCTYHYLFETPVPPGVPQLRGQREAPVPFILSPPVVQNPLRRVWRLPAVQAASASAKVSGARSSIVDPRSSDSVRASASLGGPARNTSNPQFAITSVTFPDQPRRFNPGDELSFDLTLIGRAIEYLQYVVLAVDVMARRGLGADRARFQLKEVWLSGNARCQLAREEWLKGRARRQLGRDPLASADAPDKPMPPELITPRDAQRSRPLSELIRERLADLKFLPSQDNSSSSSSLENTIAAALRELRGGDAPSPDPRALTSAPQTLAPNPQSPSSCPYSLRLRFVTPARIRVKGELQSELSFELLVRNLLRRLSMLAAVHGSGKMELDYRGLIEQAGSVRTLRSRLRWWDLERYTNRQNGKLKVGGMVGAVEYQGDAIAEFMPLLAAGELLGIGTGTSFGLGKYEVVCDREL